MLHHFGTGMDVCDWQERSLASVAFGASYLCAAFDVLCREEEDEGEDEQDNEDDEQDGNRCVWYHCVGDLCVDVVVVVVVVVVVGVVLCRLHETGQANAE